MKFVNCFKAYDVRGRVPQELNIDTAYRIGRAFSQILSAKKIVVGHDIRLTSPKLCKALMDGLTDGGADVIFIGTCGTEEVYFATFDLNTCGGICVTASHNPKDYNGMKFVEKNAKPLSNKNSLNVIKRLVELGEFEPVSKKGSIENFCLSQSYTEHLLSYITPSALKKLKIVVNAGNGGAGEIIDRLESHLPFEFIKLNHHADGNFPNGVPNPLLVENRLETSQAIKEHGADLGIAWDGDFDRCFFFDEHGDFIEGYYIVGLLAEMMLSNSPESKIIHDPRLYWNTQQLVAKNGGTAIQSKTGHAYIKESMREHNAVYGGEMSAHHYFRDFAYCDNGNIPWLLITALLCKTGKTMSTLIKEGQLNYPCSGEINNVVSNASNVINNIELRYKHRAIKIEHTDGLSMDFEDWRFNLRSSNTEPLLRLNVESRGDIALMQEKTAELLSLIPTD